MSVHVCMCNWVFLWCLSFFACLPVEWKNGKLKRTLDLTHSLIVACFWQWCFGASCRDCMCTHRLCDWPSGFGSDASLKHVEHIFSSELNVIIFTVCVCTYFLELTSFFLSMSLPSTYLSANGSSLTFSSPVVLWFLPDPSAREAGLPVLL